MCAAVVASPLSAQLEGLAVLHEARGESYSGHPQSIKVLSEAIKLLPSLKELEFLYFGGVDPRSESRLLSTDSLKTILTATPKLTTLTLDFFHTEFDDLLRPLVYLPLLSELTLRSMGPYTLKKCMHARIFVLQAMQICPRLRNIHLLPSTGIMDGLMFTRFFDGSITVRVER